MPSPSHLAAKLEAEAYGSLRQGRHVARHVGECVAIVSHVLVAPFARLLEQDGDRDEANLAADDGAVERHAVEH